MIRPGRQARPRSAPRSARRQALALFAFATFWLGAGVAPTPGPVGEDAWDAGDARVEAELLVDASALRPGGSVLVGVHFRMDPGWHIYWRNSGESGLPTDLSWRFEGAEVGPTRWPAPEVFRESDGFLTTYGYQGEVLLASVAQLSPDLLSIGRGSARISVVADFVTCEIGCIPGRIELVRELPVTLKGRPASPEISALFETFAERTPRPADALGIQVEAVHSQSAVRPGDEFETVLALRCAADSGPCSQLALAASDPAEAFLPEALAGVEVEAVGHRAQGGAGFALVLANRAWPDDPAVDLQRLRGVVPISLDGLATTIEVDVPLPRAPAGAEVSRVPSALFDVVGGFPPPSPTLSLLTAFGLALLGGLILNLMPCVLPILAIKIFHVAELAHESRRSLLGHGIAYTVGVLASMALLAGIVTGLRAAGTAVGWGFQFQEPIFVAAICAVLVVFALNLFGVFEVTFQPAAAARVGAASTGLRRSFFEGLLAVVLATPCTAPFLGTAVGFAFASPPLIVFTIFLAIGVGLAAPYALVTLVPAWARIVPRPGAWMLHVRKVLGFSLVATVVWLQWVVGRSLGVDAQTLLLVYLVVVAFVTWVFGSLQHSPHRGRIVATGVVCAAAIALGLALLPLRAERALRGVGDATVEVSGSEVGWRPYDASAIEDELRLGRAVFVDFTADWCITCKVNESVVFGSERVKAEIERLDVATFKADWTLYDEEIRAVLARFGKAGVPMYLVYRPGAPADPAVLPELLTVDLVIEALRQAAADTGVRADRSDARPRPNVPG
jgi:thiol:disulfide interchange protein DsbD